MIKRFEDLGLQSTELTQYREFCMRNGSNGFGHMFRTWVQLQVCGYRAQQST